MKLRNQLLALACLLLFIGFGVLVFRTWVVRKPFGIILFLSDGLSTNTLAATRLYEGLADKRLEAERFPNLALVSNGAADFAVPDETAAASAIATGVRVENRALAIDPKGKPLPSILALAREAGRATGLVTTGNLAGPALAAFYANAADGRDAASIAAQFLGEVPKADIALGGGLADFTPEAKGGRRKDGRDLWLELRSRGYTLVRNKAELESTPAFLTGPLAGLFADGPLSYSSQVESGSQEPSLSDMVRRAIEILQTNRGGYLLVVDCALISRAARENNGERVLTETADFDRALATARQYAGEETLILAIGKSDIGGLALNGFPLRTDHGVALLGTSAGGYPALTWSTGPNGLPDAPKAEPAGPTPPPSPSPAQEAPPALARDSKAEPAAYGVNEALPTARDMILIGVGPGSEAVRGFLPNTGLFELIKAQL